MLEKQQLKTQWVDWSLLQTDVSGETAQTPEQLHVFLEHILNFAVHPLFTSSCLEC